MANRRWIVVGLAALAVGGLVAAYPFTSSAVENLTTAAAPAAVTVAQPAAAATQPDGATAAYGCGGAGMGSMMQGGMGGMMKGGMHGGMMGAGMMQGAVAEAVYKVTGLDKQQIVTQRQAGKSFVEIAKAKGITEDKLLEEVKKVHQAFIDQGVADGVMTKEMAEYCTKNFEANIKTILESTTVGPKGGRGNGQRGFGGMGGMMRGMMGDWGQQAPVQAPSAAQGQSL